MLPVAFLSFFLALVVLCFPAPARAQQQGGVVVDDADRKVRYGPLEFRSCAQPADCFGAWFVDPRAMSLQSTLHVTGGPGTFLDFDFVGTNVSVFGALLPNGADALFTLDGGASTRVPTKSPAGAVARFQTQLFASAELAPGAHTLRVQFAGTPATELLGVDYFIVGVQQEQQQQPQQQQQAGEAQGQDPAPAPPPSSSSKASSSGNGPMSPAPASTDATAAAASSSASASSSSSASASSSSAAASSSSPSHQFSPAAAAAIGFVCAAAAIVVVLVLWTCRRRQRPPGAAQPLVSFWDFTTTQRQTQAVAADPEMDMYRVHGQVETMGSVSGARASVARWASSVHAASVSGSSSPRVVGYSSPSPTRYHNYQRSGNGDVFVAV